MRRPRPALLGLALLVLAAPRPVPADRARRLEEIRREIEESEARARSYREEARSYFQEIDAIDRQLAEMRRSQRRLRERHREAEEELKRARAGLAQARRAREKTRKDLRRRLVALYEFEAVGGIPALTSAGDFQSLVRRREGLTRVLARDEDLFERHRQAQATWSLSRDRTRRLLAEIAAARREIVSRDRRVRAESIERRNLVALLRSRSDQEERTAEELRRAAGRLEEAIESMPRESATSPGEGLVAGRADWPVGGTLRLGFGRQVDPEFGTETRRSGIEIAAPAGRPVRAVADGRVLFAGWFHGYGQLVILDHGRETLTVSGYLQEIAVEKGSLVAKGQQIGRVGETGSLSGPGLYFEIRHEGRPADPRAWLRPR